MIYKDCLVLKNKLALQLVNKKKMLSFAEFDLLIRFESFPFPTVQNWFVYYSKCPIIDVG